MVSVSNRDWVAIATACELMAFSLRYPGEELVGAVASGEWAAAANEVSRALGLGLPDGFGAEASRVGGGEAARDAESLLPGLRAEATRLLIGAPRPAVSPYEEVWRAEADGVEPVLFVGPRAMEVERFCAECGLGRPEGTNEPLDHIATEFELLEHLALLASAPPGASSGGFPGGSAAAAFGLFTSGHLAAWAGRFAERLGAEARLPYYRDVASFAQALTRKLAGQFVEKEE